MSRMPFGGYILTDKWIYYDIVSLAMEQLPSRPKPDLRQMKYSKPVANTENIIAGTNAAPAPNISSVDKATRNELVAILRRPAMDSDEK